jgi:hypothetical protein
VHCIHPCIRRQPHVHCTHPCIRTQLRLR